LVAERAIRIDVLDEDRRATREITATVILKRHCDIPLAAWAVAGINFVEHSAHRELQARQSTVRI